MGAPLSISASLEGSNLQIAVAIQWSGFEVDDHNHLGAFDSVGRW